MMIVFTSLVLSIAAVSAVLVIAFLDVAFHPPEYSVESVTVDRTLSSIRTRDLFAWFSETARSLTRSLISARRDRCVDGLLAAPCGSEAQANEPFDSKFCTARTAAAPEEILEIADYLRWTQSPKTVEAIQEQAETHSRVVTQGNQSNQACSDHLCPLLCENGTCMALPVRPIQCRVRCEMLGRTVSFSDDDTRTRVVIDGTEAGVSRAMHEAGRFGELYELSSGLSRALSVPDATERWESGEDLFQGCLPYREAVASAN